MTKTPENKPHSIRTIVMYRVCPHWRAPIFARLNTQRNIDLTVFHGKSIPGTKLINAERVEGFERKEMFTISGKVRASGRHSTWVFCPFAWWSLWRHNPDVIITEGGSNVLTNILVYAYAKLWRKPVIWWTLGGLPGRKFSGLGKLYRRVVVAMERGATVLLGYSSAALAYFDAMGYPKHKQFRAVNCVDTDRVLADIERRADRVDDLRKSLGLSHKRVVLFVGALIDPKSIHRLIHAFAAVRKTIADTHLLIVGDGPDRARLESVAAQLEVDDATTFTGQIIEGVSDYYELGDVFVLPGLGGLAVSEALAHGLPVICGQGDGCEVDLVQDGVTGFRLDSNDNERVIEFIRDRLTEILSSPQRLSDMRSAAKKLILETHNVHTYIDNIVSAVRYAHTGARESAPTTHPAADSPGDPTK